MIRTLRNIREVSAIDQYTTDNLYSFSQISFHNNEFGSGGIGSVHSVSSIDDITSEAYLVKIIPNQDLADHAFETVHILHQKIKKHQLKTGEIIFNNAPGFMGIPFLIFKGFDEVIEEEVFGFLMFNLIKLGFEDFGNDEEDSFELSNLEFNDKLYLAYQFSKTVSLLNEFNFLHSDIKSESIFLNPINLQFALIDFDSGFHTDSQEKPTIIAALTHWISDLYKDVIGQKSPINTLTTSDRVAEENWVLANGVFTLLFGAFPYFFLKDADVDTRKKYQKNFNWPEIDYSSELLNSGAIEHHKDLNNIIQSLVNAGLNELVESFYKVFNEGYKNEKKRLSAYEWVSVLKISSSNLELKPELIKFETSTQTIKRRGEEVIVRWEGKRYNSVLINGVVQKMDENSFPVNMDDAGEITIRLTNDFGMTEDVIEIRAEKIPPQIHSFRPSKFKRDSREPIVLNWETVNTTHVSINSVNKDLLSKGNIEVNPLKRTLYELTAYGFFGEKIKSQIEIETLDPEIQNFKATINLNEGIDNIDLVWVTKNVEEVTISPFVGVVDRYGIKHVPIKKPTVFTITAKGLFSQTEQQITAHPFPVPVISHLLMKAPSIEINATIKMPPKLTAEHFVQLNNMEINSSINFHDLQNTDGIINIDQKPSVISFSQLFDQIKSEIQNKLNL